MEDLNREFPEYGEDPAGTDPAAGAPEEGPADEGDSGMPEYGYPGYRENVRFCGNAGEGDQRGGEYRSRYDVYRFLRPGDSAGNSPEGGNGDNEKMRKILLWLCLAAAGILLLVVLVSAISGSGRNRRAAAGKAETAVSGGAASEPAEDKSATAESAGGQVPTGEDVNPILPMTEAVRKVMPSMVSITCSPAADTAGFSNKESSSGDAVMATGIIIRKTESELLIATNGHVVSGVSGISVGFEDGSFADGTLKGSDADSDLALISVDMSELGKSARAAVSAIEIGDSDSLEVGETVAAIGNALGYGQSVSGGIVSAVERPVYAKDGGVSYMIQTDASINPGNSGGALINMRGELVGINEIKSVGVTVEGVGYAIPAAEAMPVLERLAAREPREPVEEEEASYLGVICVTMPEYYLASGFPAGVYVSDLDESGPAARAGILTHDIITSIDGLEVPDADTLVDLLRYYRAGEELPVSVSRYDREADEFSKLRVLVSLGSRSRAVRDGFLREDGTPGQNYDVLEKAEPGKAEKDAGGEAPGKDGDDGTAEPDPGPVPSAPAPEDDGEEAADAESGAAEAVSPETPEEQPSAPEGQPSAPEAGDGGGEDGGFDFGGLFGNNRDEYNIPDFSK